MSQKLMSQKPPIFLLTCLMALPIIGETIYATSLLKIAHDFGVSDTLIKKTMSIYLLGLSLSFPLWGVFGDLYGRKKALIFGILVFILGSVFSFISTQYWDFYYARLFQGLGSGSMIVLTQAISRSVFSPFEQRKVFAIVGTSVMVAPTIGSLIGAALHSMLPWRSVFIFLIILAGIIISFIILLLKEKFTKGPSIKELFSYTPKILTDKTAIICCVYAALASATVYTYFTEGPFTFIRDLSLSHTTYCFITAIACMALLIGGLTSRYLLKKGENPRKLLLTGTLMLMASMILFSFLVKFSIIEKDSALFSATLIALLTVPTFLSITLINPCCMALALIHHRNHKAYLGFAGALIGGGAFLLSSLINFALAFLPSGLTISFPLFILSLSLAMLITYGIGRNSLEEASVKIK